MTGRTAPANYETPTGVFGFQQESYTGGALKPTPTGADTRGMSAPVGNLVLNLRRGDQVQVGEDLVVTFLGFRSEFGDIRVAFSAPRDVPVVRTGQPREQSARRPG